MSLLKSSIGKKLVMSISGLFLMVFLLVHLCANLFSLVPDGGVLFNQVAEFMGTNPIIQVMQPVLALGFVIHIIYATVLSIYNIKARGGNSYASGNLTPNVSFSSKNMYVLGIMVLAFLVMHIWSFFIPIHTPVALGATKLSAYALVHGAFQSVIYTFVNIVFFAALGFHLTHGFWSAFQTTGLNNSVWYPRLKCIAKIYAIIVSVGFIIIALAQCFCPIYR